MTPGGGSRGGGLNWTARAGGSAGSWGAADLLQDGRAQVARLFHEGQGEGIEEVFPKQAPALAPGFLGHQGGVSCAFHLP
jgi:hypothetical protein